MPPKKATSAASQKKAAAPASHPSYKDMIKEAILAVSRSRHALYRRSLVQVRIMRPPTTDPRHQTIHALK
ncbi:MAG: hypothetical protein Q9196_001858 [Gyalolechia fulgens]